MYRSQFPSPSKQIGSCLNKNLSGQIFICHVWARHVAFVYGEQFCVGGCVIPGGCQSHLFISTKPFSYNSIAGSLGNWFSWAVQILEFIIIPRYGQNHFLHINKELFIILRCSLNSYWSAVCCVPSSRLHGEVPRGKRQNPWPRNPLSRADFRQRNTMHTFVTWPHFKWACPQCLVVGWGTPKEWGEGDYGEHRQTCLMFLSVEDLLLLATCTTVQS